MNHNFKLVEKHYDYKKYFRPETERTEINYNDLNQIEGFIAKNGLYIMMVDYVSYQGDIISYYLIIFNFSEMVDILKINILNDTKGFKLHSVTCRSGHQGLEDEFKSEIDRVIGIDFLLDDEYCYFSEHEDIAYIIDPKNGHLKSYIDIIKKSH